MYAHALLTDFLANRTRYSHTTPLIRACAALGPIFCTQLQFALSRSKMLVFTDLDFPSSSRLEMPNVGLCWLCMSDSGWIRA